jgi:hypothetical protein
MLIGIAGRARYITIGAARICLKYGCMESCAQGRGRIGEYLVVAHSCEAVQGGIGGGIGGVSS